MSDPTYDPGYEPAHDAGLEYRYAQPPADRSVKIPHLVFGLLFLGIAGIWALGTSGVISGERLTILGPVVLIGAGVVGLAASLASGRNRRRTTPTSYAESYDQNHRTTPTTDRVSHEGDDEPTEEIR